MLHNLVLAGDWTDTGLPATIDGAIQSGQTAAQNLLKASHGS
jgi:monoamine oxidase